VINFLSDNIFRPRLLKAGGYPRGGLVLLLVGLGFRAGPNLGASGRARDHDDADGTPRGLDPGEPTATCLSSALQHLLHIGDGPNSRWVDEGCVLAELEAGGAGRNDRPLPPDSSKPFTMPVSAPK
jgi:hypothetical protein